MSERPRIEWRSETGEWFGELKINGTWFTTTYGNYKHEKHVKHKIAMELLRQASLHDKAALHSFRKLKKESLYVKDESFPESASETEFLEFKGGRDQFHAMQESHVINMMKDFPKEICSFLNANVSARFIVGVHNDTGTVQGISVNNSNTFLNRISQSIEDSLEPKPSQYLKIHLHPVRIFNPNDTSFISAPRRGVDNYTEYLEERVENLLNHFRNTPKHNPEEFESSLFLLEMLISSSETVPLYLANHRAYIRKESKAVPMTLDELKERVLHQQGVHEHLNSING